MNCLTFSCGDAYQLSALREASLAREMHDFGVAGMQSLYMGWFPHLDVGYIPDFTSARFLHPLLPEDAIQGAICTVLPG